MNLRQRGAVAGGLLVCVCWSAAPAKDPPPLSSRLAAEGRRLFALNCAHCHADDARGDEGPSLYDLRKSDERIGRIIRNGIKGEMPSFGAKLDDRRIEELIAFLRTLKS